jgi:Flp pilus assembly protein TadD
MITASRTTGVPDGLPPDELERWSNDLVAFLTSEDVPVRFRQWAHSQADLVDAYMASAEDLDADDDVDDDDEPDDDVVEEACVATAPRRTPKRKSPRAPKRGVGGQRAATGSLPSGPGGRLILGVIVGAVVLLAIIGVRSLVQDGSSDGGSTLPAAAQAPAFDQARADALQALLQQDPNNQDALFELGELNFEGERFEASIEALTKLVALDPANKQALNDIGTANFNLGRPDDAKTWWRKTLAVDPNDVQAHYNMGFVYANAEPRDLAAAVGEWETVVRLDPTSQLGQTAKVHVDGLKAKLTPAAGSGAAAPAPTAAP